MINNLETSLSVIPDSQLDELFKDSLPTNEEGNEGKQDKPLLPGQEKKVTIKGGDFNLPLLEDTDELFNEETDEEKVARETKEKTEAEATEKAKKAAESETPEQKTAREAKEKVEADAKKAAEDAEKNKPAAEAISEILTNTVNYLVEKKIFKDFEGRADMKFTEELYSELLEKQLDAIAEDRYSSKKKSAGEYGEAIIDYIEKGGDPDLVIDLFKEQKAIQEFDTSTDEGKKELVVKWYREVHGWKPERIQKEINNLLAEDGALDAEAQDIKGKYDAQYKAQLEDIKEEQAAIDAANLQKKKDFEKSITKVIDTTPEYDDKRKKFLKDSILKLKKTDRGVVNDLYIKFVEYQTDPVKYVRLSEFLLDEDGLTKRKEAQIQGKTTSNTFNFIKGNSATSKNRGSKHEDLDREKTTGTNFSFI